ncbi:hypothetical protein COV11_03765 [Candidatus Woesearchaeota archaeon CG10_big_fil_rev_8_21_14_0_10_30_7]|nr:MAG: hypothetical protein COV11_03765 [Candidatus Woesearchaeota archaeon CG10_big_fil_rev_8_21_14_0_10_30_7]
MSLEKKFKQKNVFLRRSVPAEGVVEEVKKGNKFIVINETPVNIPLGYMFIDMQYKGESFKTLVPQNLLFFQANPGEGDADEALNELSDFYDNVQDFEDELLEENDDSVQGANWAVITRKNYGTYLINKLTKASTDDVDIPEWDEKILEKLDLTDDYIVRRVKAMAAVALGKTTEQVKKHDLGDVLKHVTINERKVEQLSKEEFDQVTCWAGSHYEIKDEYKHNPNAQYSIEQRHDKTYKVGNKLINKREIAVLDAKIEDLEQEIRQYRRKKGSSIGRHDEMLLRTYTNLAFIAKENSRKQLEIKPNKGTK